MLTILDINDTIVALSTPDGIGALALIRLSGSNSISIVQKIWKGKELSAVSSHTLAFGKIQDDTGQLVDEVVIGIYRAPNSYTQQEVVEISCHGSPYIVQRLLQLLIKYGARPAAPGEFTLRAFMAGGLDLSQAEAVADLIAARSAQSHQLAINQLRGGYSSRLAELRTQLVNFAALIELELDFSEEDVEFANRDDLSKSLQDTLREVEKLSASFDSGNALKNGIPVAIVGEPNVGKSTLLNRLLQEERAIVSPIPGTTRDVIEDILIIRGHEFRLIDTAGIRDTTDTIEAEGVQRTLKKITQATIVLLLFDATATSWQMLQTYGQQLSMPKNTHLIYVANKADLPTSFTFPEEVIHISAKTGIGQNVLEDKLVEIAKQLAEQDFVITNQRHAFALQKSAESIGMALQNLESGKSSELMAIDIRHALHHLGEITGEVTTDEILGTIFSKFCIGK